MNFGFYLSSSLGHLKQFLWVICCVLDMPTRAVASNIGACSLPISSHVSTQQTKHKPPIVKPEDSEYSPTIPSFAIAASSAQLANAMTSDPTSITDSSSSSTSTNKESQPTVGSLELMPSFRSTHLRATQSHGGQATSDVEKILPGSDFDSDFKIRGPEIRTVRGLRWFLVCFSLYLSCFLYGVDTTIAAGVQGYVVEGSAPSNNYPGSALVSLSPPSPSFLFSALYTPLST
jgi:hypothetical protein